MSSEDRSAVGAGVSQPGKRTIAVPITGASGAMYATRTMTALVEDLADFMSGKIPAAPGFPHTLYPGWEG